MKKHFSSYWIRSAFFTFLQRFSLTFFGFLNLMLLTRSLSIGGMGVWALFLTITGIFEMTKSSLLKNAHIKYVSSNDNVTEQTAIASSSFLINAAITGFFILLVVFFSGWISRWFRTGAELRTMLYWFIPGMIFMVFFAHLEAVQQSFLDFKGGFAGYMVRQVTFFGIIFIHWLMKWPLTLAGLSMYQSISIGLGTAFLYWHTRKYLHYRFNPEKRWIRSIMAYGGYIFGSGMIANISNNLDQLMIGRFIDPGSVAYYNVASRNNLLVDIPSYAASEILFPKASRASVEEGLHKVKYLYEKMVAVLLAFTVPTAILIIVFPHVFTYIVGGRAYSRAALILQLYMITGIFRPAQNQAANLLNSIGKPRLVFIANTIYLAGFLGINYLCLSAIGFYGAAVGTLISSLLGFTGWYFIMKKQIGLDLSGIGRHTADVYRLIYRKSRELLTRGA